MNRYLHKFKNFWLEDLSFMALLIMLIFIVFVVPIVMSNTKSGITLYNTILLCVFFSGIFSTSNKWLVGLSATLFTIHFVLRLIRFGDNPYSFNVLEDLIAIANSIVFIIINIRLLFRNNSVNIYRVVGAINVYLLFALMGALALEVINSLTGVSIGGDVALNGTDQDYVDFIYFSMVSLTTVGFGEIYPISVETKMLSVFLSAIGILFPAVVISKLVGMSDR